ncbi:MAG TPA: VWA domain-containing protein, partial [Chthonomonadales bacterium]|nr:VWA domain-containing protein [Chthonomonadales bacterium]
AVDNSFSMGYRDAQDGKTSFEKAVAAADTVLRTVLKSGDSASLVLISDHPVLAVGAPSFDLSLLRKRLKAAAVQDRATSYLTAARSVDALLRSSTAPVKEVYWITDDQASGWSRRKAAGAAVWKDLTKRARLVWISAGPPPDRRNNLAVLNAAPGRELVTPRLPATIRARVANFGKAPRNGVQVDLLVDGRPAASTKVSLPAGSSKEVQFPYLFTQSGSREGSVALEDAQHADGLAADNSAPFVARVRKQIDVLVLDPAATTNPAASSSFFLVNAMAPSGASEGVAPDVRYTFSLSGLDLRRYNAIVFSEIRPVSASDLRRLAGYVSAGGGLLLFPGPGTNPPSVARAWGEVLPAGLGAPRVLQPDQAVTLNPATIVENPAFAGFKNSAEMNLGTALFTEYLPLAPALNAETLARFSNGAAAFVEKKEGLGKVILAASSGGTAWNDLPRRSVYVPLVYQIITYLGSGPTGSRNLRQGQPFTLYLPVSMANKVFTVRLPDGRSMRQTSVMGAQGASLTFAQTADSGVYHITGPSGAPADAFAVAMPETESNLAYADPARSAAAAGVDPRRLTLISSNSPIRASVYRSRYGAELWRPLVLALIPLLFLESLLAQRFGRRG